MNSNGLLNPINSCVIVIKNPYNASYEYKKKFEDPVKNHILLIDELKDDIALNFAGSPKKDIFNLLYLGKILKNSENVFKLPNFTNENKYVFHFIFKNGAPNMAAYKKKIIESKEKKEIPKNDPVNPSDVHNSTSNDKFPNLEKVSIPSQKSNTELIADYYREYYQRQTQYYTQHGTYFDASLFTMNQYVQEAHQKSHLDKNSTQLEIRNRITDQNTTASSPAAVVPEVDPQQNVVAAPAAPVAFPPVNRRRRRGRIQSFCCRVVGYFNTCLYRIAQILVLVGFGLQFYQENTMQVPFSCVLFAVLIHYSGVRFRRTRNLSLMEKIYRFFIGLIFSIYPDWNATLLRARPPVAAVVPAAAVAAPVAAVDPVVAVALVAPAN